MKTYTVHYRPEAGVSMTGLANDAILVKEGFSWPAFFIPFIWLIYQRMWIVFAAFIAIQANHCRIDGRSGFSRSGCHDLFARPQRHFGI